MSLNISITKTDLQKAIDLHKSIALFKPLSGVYGGSWNYDFEGGWHKFRFTAGYPKVAPFPPFIPINLLEPNQAVRFGAVFYIVDLFDSYVLFNEPYPTAATEVEGFYLTSTGTLQVRSNSGPTGTTSMTVASGDIIVAEWLVSNVGGTIYIQWGAGKYDWVNDTYTATISAYATMANPRNLRYIILWEPNGTQGRVAIGPYIVVWNVNTTAPTSGLDPGQIVGELRRLRQIGLQDPSTLDMTTV